MFKKTKVLGFEFVPERRNKSCSILIDVGRIYLEKKFLASNSFLWRQFSFLLILEQQVQFYENNAKWLRADGGEIKGEIEFHME